MASRRLPLAGLALGVGLVAAGVAQAMRPQSYSPEQPIAFSHAIHVSDNKIDCQYCHSAARRSPFAGVPSVERCMGCHAIVASGKPQVVKLKNYQDRGEPIPWVKVFVLPRFVRFNHEPHVRARVDCSTCHGPVATMGRVTRATALEMGWCLECHREKGAPVDCLTCHY